MENLLVVSTPAGEIVCLDSSNGFVIPFKIGDEAKDLKKFLQKNKWNSVGPPYIADLIFEQFEKEK